jgi:acetyl esterase
MLQQVRQWLLTILQGFVVWAFRWAYRLANAWNWRDHVSSAPFRSLDIPGNGRSIPARLYPGDRSKNKPLIVFFHGGGWVIGDLHTHHPYCQALSARTGCSVIAVEYALAPERPFPAGPDDCLAATQWIARHTAELAPGNGRLLLAGDSAGANLATCTCLEADPETRRLICGQFLIYPATDHYSAGYSSHIDKATGYYLTARTMQWFWDHYLGKQGTDNPDAARAMPIHSEKLASLPPTLLVTAENDPLRDEGAAYADRLRDAGISVRFRKFDTAAHGFATSEGPNDNYDELMDELDSWLKALR